MSRIRFRRRTFIRFYALLVLLGSAAVIGLAAQPPREVEDPKGKVVKKIVVDDDDRPASKRRPGEDDPRGSRTPPDVRLEELVRAADETRTPFLKELYARYFVPFDRLTESGGSIRVKPVAYREAEFKGAEAIEIIPLDAAGKVKETRAEKVSDIRKVEPFEMLVLEEAERLQKQKIQGVTPIEQLAAAEKLLAAALHFHDFSRIEHRVDGKPRNLRRGKGWDEIRKPLVDKLVGTQVELLQALVDSGDAVHARETIARLIAAYPFVANDPIVARVSKAVAAVQLAEAERLLKSGADPDAFAARKLFDELQAAYPGSGGDAAKKVQTELRELAAKALNRAREKKSVGADQIARDELARAISLDPDVEGIRELQRVLQPNYQTLYVGVRQFPQNMSPATARLDSEKQAVELVFEGLLQEIPDENGGVQYRPGSALGMPVAIPGGRDFSLRTNCKVDASGRPCFDSHDVVGTVNMLRTRPDSWVAYPLYWLSAEPPAIRDNPSESVVRINLAAPHPDPRALFTFKMLPTRWMAENGKSIDDGLFAENPFGTGPFRLQQRAGNNATREMVFVNNPIYGRGDRLGLPNIREIRMVEISKLDPMRAFQENRLHLLPDIPTAEIEKYTGPGSALRAKVDVVTSTCNRRVHILAVNLRRPELQSKVLRQGLSMAIDREEVLRKEFRAGKPEFHKAMTGPFPPGTWAANRGPAGPQTLFNRDLAVVRLKSYLAANPNARRSIDLAYPEEDPVAERACNEIKKQVEDLFRGEPANSKLAIRLEKKPLALLLTDVQDQFTYDLAYIPFDYPDDWYPLALGGALDSNPEAAKRGGRNWFGFLTPDTNPENEDQELGRALNRIRNYRDFQGELVPQSANISKLFNESLPFIPLWQLDRHMVVSRRVKVFLNDFTQPSSPRLLNQTLLFQGVERWRME